MWRVHQHIDISVEYETTMICHITLMKGWLAATAGDQHVKLIGLQIFLSREKISPFKADRIYST